MIRRILQKNLEQQLKKFPAVAILGQRQVGKTTLAKTIAKSMGSNTVYLDLERDSDLMKLNDAESYLEQHKDQCVILDEVQRKPNLYALLRSLIDDYRKPGRFMLLGSASPHLVKGVSESLAGRIYYAHLHPFNLLEIEKKAVLKKHWFRGGMPEALLAKTDEDYINWTDAFISTYIQRDMPELFDVRFSVSVMRNFWTMLAHNNGAIWNAENYARSLGVTAPTVNRYLDFLEAAFIIHRLPAFFQNVKKRLVKAPKIYLQDTGVLHRLLRIADSEHLQGNPIVGASWEGYIVEQIFQLKNDTLDMYFYRTQDGAECDVVLAKAHKPIACIEIKYSNAPDVSKGFYLSADALKSKKNFVITPGSDTYMIKNHTMVCSIKKFLKDFLPQIK